MVDEERVSRIRKLAAELDSKTDSLNATFDRLEEKLSPVGVELLDTALLCEERVEIEVDASGFPSSKRTVSAGWQLGWLRLDDGFHLAVRYAFDDVPPDAEYSYLVPGPWDSPSPEWKRLRSASRAVRLAAAGRLELFTMQMEAKLKEMIALVGIAEDVAR
jgi:hypothetical protein